jgi:alkylhydroperoxidase family enzyme
MGDDTVNATLADLERAPVPHKVKVTLRLLEKVTRDHAALTPEDFEPVLAAGVSPEAIVEALNVAWCFNTITRLADAFEFEVGPRAAFDAAAKMLLTRGYK